MGVIANEVKTIREAEKGKASLFSTLNTPEQITKIQQTLQANNAEAQRFIATMIAYIKASSDLSAIAAQNPVSLMKAVIKVAQLGLDVTLPNEIHIVPFNNHKTGVKDAVVVPGYKGLQKLARRAGVDLGDPFTVLDANEIYENDEFYRELGTNPSIVHKPGKFGQRGKVIGVYAIAVSKINGVRFVELTMEEVLEHKKRYVKAKNGPYTYSENDVQYGLKTAMRRLVARKLDLTPKLGSALSLDAYEDKVDQEEVEAYADYNGDVVDTQTGEIVEPEIATEEQKAE